MYTCSGIDHFVLITPVLIGYLLKTDILSPMRFFFPTLYGSTTLSPSPQTIVNYQCYVVNRENPLVNLLGFKENVTSENRTKTKIFIACYNILSNFFR